MGVNVLVGDNILTCIEKSGVRLTQFRSILRVVSKAPDAWHNRFGPMSHGNVADVKDFDSKWLTLNQNGLCRIPGNVCFQGMDPNRRYWSLLKVQFRVDLDQIRIILN